MASEASDSFSLLVRHPVPKPSNLLDHMWLSLETCVPPYYGSLQTKAQSSSPPGTLWIYIPEVLDLVCPEPPCPEPSSLIFLICVSA